MAEEHERPFALFCHFGITTLRQGVGRRPPGSIRIPVLVSVEAHVTGVADILALEPQPGTLDGKMDA